MDISHQPFLHRWIGHECLTNLPLTVFTQTNFAAHFLPAKSIFTALHTCRAVFPTAKVFVCLSVRLSVTHVNCDKTNESSAEILITYERYVHVVFRTQRMVGGGRPLLPEILGRTDPPSFKNGDFHSIFARSGSTVAHSEKSSIMTNRSSVRVFQ